MEILGEYLGVPMRIDMWLAKQFPYSRNFFHHIIQRGGVKVMKKKSKTGLSSFQEEGDYIPVKKSYLLQPGDKVCIDDIKRYLSPLVLEEAPDISLPVVCETDDYCVIDKPKGVLSHPTSIWEVSQPSVVGFLYHRYKALPSVGDFIRSGLLHRLDKDTDGFLLVAKTEYGLKYFKSLFQEKSLAPSLEAKEAVPLRKCYTACCCVTKEGENFIKTISPHLPYVLIRDVQAKVPHYKPKIGITKILSWSVYESRSEIYEIYKKALPKGMLVAKVEVEIFTGRTHQVRYHLASCGLPIVGDFLYNAFFAEKKRSEQQLPLCLSATYLAFRDCYGNDKVFEKTFPCIF